MATVPQTTLDRVNTLMDEVTTTMRKLHAFIDKEKAREE